MVRKALAAFAMLALLGLAACGQSQEPPPKPVVVQWPKDIPVSTGPNAVVTPVTDPIMAVMPDINFQPLFVDFLTPRIGWLAGNLQGTVHGILLHTTDGGRTWTSSRMLAGEYDALSFISPTDGWATIATNCNPVGCKSTDVIRTSDEGSVWRAAKALSGEPVPHGLATFGPDVVAITQTSVAVSPDGGATWSVHQLPSGLTVQSAAFTSPQDGYVSGTATCAPGLSTSCAVLAYRTTDGGASWSEVFTEHVASGAFAASTVAAFGTDAVWLHVSAPGDTLLRSADGGATWTNLGAALSATALNVNQMRFTTPSTGYAALGVIWENGGPPVPNGALMVTRDGGKTWTDLSPVRSMTFWSAESLSIDASGGVWVANSGGGSEDVFLAHLASRGGKWAQAFPALTPCVAVSFVSPEVGFGIGLPIDPNAVLATRNGGLTWHIVGTMPRQDWPESVRFTSRTTGYVAALNGRRTGGNSVGWDLLRTTDGGKTWHVEKAMSLSYSRAQRPVVQSPALFVESGTTFLETDASPKTAFDTSLDGGATFRREVWNDPDTWGRPAPALLSPDVGFDVVMTPQDNASVGTYVPHVQATNDGGRTFRTLVNLTQGSQILGMSASSRSVWLLVVTAGAAAPAIDTIWHSADAGASWVVMPLSFPGRPAWEDQLAAPSWLPILQLDTFGVDVDALSVKDAWLLTSQGLLRTTDGGKTWTPLNRS